MTARPSILVVDDESAILDTVRILLKSEGFDVTVAQGGRAGLEALEQDPPAIVLTDVRMPGVTGIDLLKAARARDADMPVILMTAQAELRTAIEAVNLLPFHRSARDKHRKFGMPWRLECDEEIPRDRVEAWAGRIAERGLKVGIGG